MEFYDVVGQVLELLQRQKRVSYRALKRQFSLDDDYLEDVKDELIYAKRLAADEENRVLVWVGDTDSAIEPSSSPALPEDSPFLPLDPPQRRQRTLDGLKHILRRESQSKPLVLVFEDLHWIDSETLALLDSLVESLPTAQLLLLVNYRPEYTHRWGGKTDYTQLRLDPLPSGKRSGRHRRWRSAPVAHAPGLL